MRVGWALIIGFGFGFRFGFGFDRRRKHRVFVFFFVEEEEEIKGVELSVSIPRTIYTLTLCLFSIQGSELKDEPYHSDTDPEVSIVQQELFHIILRKRFVAHTAHVKRA